MANNRDISIQDLELFGVNTKKRYSPFEALLVAAYVASLVRDRERLSQP